jgi:PKD repeat protein
MARLTALATTLILIFLISQVQAITIVYPKGGEVFKVGDVITLKAKDESATSVKFYYSKNMADWIFIGNATKTDDIWVCSWNTSNVEVGNYYIRAVAIVNNKTQTDESGEFAIANDYNGLLIGLSDSLTSVWLKETKIDTQPVAFDDMFLAGDQDESLTVTLKSFEVKTTPQSIDKLFLVGDIESRFEENLIAVNIPTKPDFIDYLYIRGDKDIYRSFTLLPVSITTTPIPFDRLLILVVDKMNELELIPPIGTIGPNEPPISNFTFTPVKPKAEFPVTFTSTSTDSDGYIVEYIWDFGDGLKLITHRETVKHTYTKPGVYNVTLTVKDNEGATNSTFKLIKILPLEPKIGLTSADAPLNSTNVKVFVVVSEVSSAKGFHITVKYNPKIIKFAKIEGADKTPTYIYYYDNNGTLNMSIIFSEPVKAIEECKLIAIVFNATGVGTTSVKITKANASDEHYNVFDLEIVENGTVTIHPVKGDFNFNGYVDIGDVCYVADMVTDKIPDDLAADFNGNGRVDIGDLAKIAYYLLDKIKEL